MRRADGQRVWVLECVLVNVFGSLFAKKKGFWESFVQKDSELNEIDEIGEIQTDTHLC